jgi:surfeit locus 1 family protein
LKNRLSFSIFVYSFILIFLALGTWQVIRLNWKIELINSIEQSLKSEPVEFNGSNPINFKKIKFEGILDNSKIIYLYSLNENGEPGFDIVNPISINNKSYLINRGWIPRELKLKKYLSTNTKFEGILKLKSKYNYFKPENNLKTNYWFTLKDEDLLNYTGKEFSPFIINNISKQNEIYPKSKQVGANISNNHLKYALTWFSLAVSIFLIYLYFRKKNY